MKSFPFLFTSSGVPGTIAQTTEQLIDDVGPEGLFICINEDVPRTGGSQTLLRLVKQLTENLKLTPDALNQLFFIF